MASWVTHLMIADRVLEKFQGLDRHGFCVGNIAPDCNVENEDWTEFTPPRAVTHWMSAERKVASDCDRFYKVIIRRCLIILTMQKRPGSAIVWLILDGNYGRIMRRRSRNLSLMRNQKE